MTDTRKPLDHWLPPEGAGKAIACLTTSFTFEADFFEQQCLSRFLGLDWKRDEGDNLAFLIEQEDKLAETRVSVLVDRASATEGRSLRWDLLPIAVRGGVMHAKVTVLVWERLVRAIVGSANLTSAGYRRQLEAQIVLDASPESGVPIALFEDLLDAVEELVDRSLGRSSAPGPKQQARATLDDARRQLTSFGRQDSRRAMPRMAVITGAPGRPVLDQVERVWRGGPPRAATVLSPFFDAADEPSEATAGLIGRLAERGPASATFVVAAEQIASRVRIQAPRTILEEFPARIDTGLCELALSADEEPRPLHAKALVLESASHVAALIGSSNFTSAGLGLSASANLEINIAIGATRGSEAGRALRRLIPTGDPIVLDEVDFDPQPAEEDQREPELPWGFAEALVEAAPEACLRLRLGQPLPGVWRISDHTGRALTDQDVWDAAGQPRELVVPLADDAFPYFLRVAWNSDADELRATWPVNVADKATLPPPEELRNLPVQALLRALASTRPLHESLSDAIRAGAHEDGSADELDPLRRFSATGQLLRRAKEMSLALSGLRQRLERPAASKEALIWRLRGPFGPVEIAKGLIDQARSGGAVPGETSFLLAELALTLARVNWRESGRLLPDGTRTARREAREVLAELRGMHEDSGDDPGLSAYVDRAFAEATL